MVIELPNHGVPALTKSNTIAEICGYHCSGERGQKKTYSSGRILPVPLSNGEPTVYLPKDLNPRQL
jgi:hypothetical protein